MFSVDLGNSRFLPRACVILSMGYIEETKLWLLRSLDLWSEQGWGHPPFVTRSVVSHESFSLDRSNQMPLRTMRNIDVSVGRLTLVTMRYTIPFDCNV